jgi:hypothetical protein
LAAREASGGQRTGRDTAGDARQAGNAEAQTPEAGREARDGDPRRARCRASRTAITTPAPTPASIAIPVHRRADPTSSQRTPKRASSNPTTSGMPPATRPVAATCAPRRSRQRSQIDSASSRIAAQAHDGRPRSSSKQIALAGISTRPTRAATRARPTS